MTDFAKWVVTLYPWWDGWRQWLARNRSFGTMDDLRQKTLQSVGFGDASNLKFRFSCVLRHQNAILGSVAYVQHWELWFVVGIQVLGLVGTAKSYLD